MGFNEKIYETRGGKGEMIYHFVQNLNEVPSINQETVQLK